LIQVSQDALERVEALHNADLCLQAYHEALKTGPLLSWTGRRAQVLAGRVAANLGGYRISRVQHWLAWRADKNNPDLVAYYGFWVLQKRGPLAALEFLERYAVSNPGGGAKGMSHLCTLQALVAAQFRDFSSSEEWLDRAAKLTSNDPWVATTRARVLEFQDRYQESLEAAQEALKLKAWYRPGVQALAHALQLLDRDEEALVLLASASQQIESMHVIGQLAALQQELRLYDQASSSLERFVRLAPLIEEQERGWVQRQQITLDCLRNRTGAALAAARQIDEPSYRELAQRLETGSAFRRVLLDVPFVRQHHMTCVPATLSALSRFWQMPADHLEVAEKICYDGTAAHSERHWGDTNGWITREFTVSWESAVALLDRGVPFTLTTSGATSGHVQAVVGYDEARQTLWIRDPFVYTVNEFGIKPLLENQRATGPRGMALVPTERGELLGLLELPDSALYDQLHQVERSLAQHHRTEAAEQLRQMEASAPEHRLTLTARRAIAAYDGNLPVLMQSLEGLLKQFPNDGHLNLAKLGCLRELARREERLLLLEQLCARPGVEPIFWQQYCQELRVDGREVRAATSWARWALRFRPTDPVLISTWADLLWDKHEFEQAARYYRLAAGLGEKNGKFARTYFIAARHLRRTDEAVKYLKERAQRFGGKSIEPTMVLVQSLHELGRTSEAFSVLDAALPNAPEPGMLRLFAADFHGRFARFSEADRLLSEAKGACPPAQWHRAAAALAGYQNQKQSSLEHWREVLKTEPLSHEAIRAISLLVAETEGRQSALRFLDELCEKFPYSLPLLTLRIQWLDDESAAPAIEYLRQLVEVNRADAWAWRELAIKVAATGDAAEAEKAVQEAITLEPHAAAGYCVRGDLFARAGRSLEAHGDYGNALRLEVDNEHALSRFVETAGSLSERKQALSVVTQELRRQVIFSGALFAYQNTARGLLPQTEVLELLREAHQARPDLWQAWSVLTGELVNVGKFEEALALAKESTTRFPLLPRLWVEMSRVEQARLNETGEIAALEKALELSPSYTFAARRLAGIYERRNELARARKIYEQAISATPLDPFNYGCLAQVLWKSGERDKAILNVKQALRLEPGYDWGWRALRDWAGTLNQPGLATDLAREFTRVRGGETRSWLILAGSLNPQTDGDELFKALERALELNRRCEEAYDSYARALTRLGRFDQALVQCSPPGLQPAPVKLCIRAAWVEAERGNLGKAIERAKTALAEHPEYYGGWQLLADWYVRSQALEKAIHAAEKMVELAPLESVPLGYLGDLKLRLDDRPGARSAFERAFRLDPDYSYAGYQLFAMWLADRETDAAEKVLKVLTRSGENHQTVSCAVQLACVRSQFEQALQLFGKLCRLSDAEHWTLANAAAALEQANYGRKVDRELESCLQDQQNPANVAGFWVERQVKHGRWGLQKQLRKLAAGGDARRRAVLVYLSNMGEAFQRRRAKKDVTGMLRLRYHFWRLLKVDRPWLHRDLEGWGKVGYVLTCIGRPKPVIAWLGDWRTRPNVESWMLYNLVVMLQRNRQYEATRDIVRFGVNLRHGDEFHDVFRLWAAFEEALQGNMDPARAHLAALPARVARADFEPVRAMTQILIQIQQPGGVRQQVLQSVKSGVRTAFGKTRPSSCVRYVRDGYGRFLKTASRQLPGLSLWGWWYYRGSDWLTVGFLTLLIPAGIALPPLGLLLLFAALKRARRD
jgi:cellulose synthase operon protein C